MAALKDEVKTYIVTALACFDSTKQVMADVKEKFGLTLVHQQVSFYDPNTKNGKRLSKQLTALFEETRAAFKKSAGDIPIAQSTYRLRVLDRLARKAEERGNVNMAAQLLEQAAKEAGGLFTNRLKHEHTGRDGGPLQQVTMTPEELRKVARDVAAEV